MPPAIEARFRGWAEKEPQPTRGVRIALGLTLLSSVDAEVFLRWVDLLRTHWWPGPVFHARDMYVTQARNLVLHKALKRKDEWEALLFWDADQLPGLAVPGPLPWQAANGEIWKGGFLTDYLDWLVVAEPHKKVIAGLYYSKEDNWEVTEAGAIIHGPHDPVAYVSPEGKGYHHLPEELIVPMLQRRGLYQVDGAGTGSMLIRKELIERMRELKGGDIFEAPPSRGEGDQVPGTQWTEDLYFCEQVRKELGETIWLDTAMESGHFQRRLVVSKTYLEAHGFTTAPHEQTSRAIIERDRNLRPVNQSQENERRRNRIILPR